MDTSYWINLTHFLCVSVFKARWEIQNESNEPDIPNPTIQQIITTPQADLCQRCQQLGLEELAQLKIKRNHFKFISDLGDATTLKLSDCTLCQLLESVIPSARAADGFPRKPNCYLFAFSANERFARLAPRIKASWKVLDTTMIAVLRLRPSEEMTDWEYDQMEKSLLETGYISLSERTSTGSRIAARHISQEQFDYQLAKDWLNICEQHHPRICTSRHPPAANPFQVIDCQNGLVVLGPQDCQYLALSYVWGKGPSLDSCAATSPERLGPSFPQVVQDSMRVTLDLGFRYLWVDKYCINQHDVQEKEKQISCMDSIYRGAECTIIAAAGEDSNFGLPGVSTPRSPQSWLQYGNIIALSTLKSPELSIRQSRWAK